MQTQRPIGTRKSRGSGGIVDNGAWWYALCKGIYLQFKSTKTPTNKAQLLIAPPCGPEFVPTTLRVFMPRCKERMKGSCARAQRQSPDCCPHQISPTAAHPDPGSPIIPCLQSRNQKYNSFFVKLPLVCTSHLISETS